MKAFATQDGSTTYGNATPVSTDRLPYTVVHIIPIIADELVECGIYGEISGAVSMTGWDFDIKAEVFKR